MDRKNASELETVSFDEYYFVKDATRPDGKIGGRIRCRNTESDCQINDYAKEESRIREWKKQQILASISQMAMKKLTSPTVYRLPKMK